MRTVALLALGLAFSLPCSLLAQTAEGKAEAKSVLEARSKEISEVKAKATEVTKKIGDLASSGKLPQDEAGIQELRRLVDELATLNQRLTKVEEEVTRVLRYLEGLDESLPKLTKDVDLLKRHKEGNYVQFQYRDSDQRGGSFDGFRLRRVRLGFTDKIDNKTSFKVSFDLAANPNLIGANGSSLGSTNTDQNAQIRDAYLDFTVQPASDKLAGTFLRAGQFNMPLGSEIERSSSDREFPERAQYNQVLWPGERNRGVIAKTGLTKEISASVALTNSMGVNDAEQRTAQGSPGGRLGTALGLRYSAPRGNIGLSAFLGQRPAQQAGYIGATGRKVYTEEVDRRLFYLDGELVNLFVPGLSFRGEAMAGKDRPGVQTVGTDRGSSDAGITDPTSGRLKGRDVAGYQAQLAYALNPRNKIVVRYEQWDPNLDASGDLFRGYGLAYIHNLNPNAKITLAHEVFEDDSRTSIRGKQQFRYGVTTIRVQYKF